MKHGSLRQWAQQVGSTACTTAGQIRAIRAHIAKVRPVWETARWTGRTGTEEDCRAKLRADRIEKMPVLRYANEVERHLMGVVANIDHAHPVQVVAGDIAPIRFGTGYGFRWRGKWKTAKGSYQPSTLRWVVGHLWLARLMEIPAGASAAKRHAADLDREISASTGPGRRERYHWNWDCGDRDRWVRCGIAVRMPEDLEARFGRWEHGADEAACAAEIQRKRAIVAAAAAAARDKRKAERRAKLVLRLCRGAIVDAEKVRQVGACQAGIEAWCRNRGVDPAGTLPLVELARDRRAAPYALAIARAL